MTHSQLTLCVARIFTHSLTSSSFPTLSVGYSFWKQQLLPTSSRSTSSPASLLACLISDTSKSRGNLLDITAFRCSQGSSEERAIFRPKDFSGCLAHSNRGKLPWLWLTGPISPQGRPQSSRPMLNQFSSTLCTWTRRARSKWSAMYRLLVCNSRRGVKPLIVTSHSTRSCPNLPRLTPAWFTRTHACAARSNFDSQALFMRTSACACICGCCGCQ